METRRVRLKARLDLTIPRLPRTILARPVRPQRCRPQNKALSKTIDREGSMDFWQYCIFTWHTWPSAHIARNHQVATAAVISTNWRSSQTRSVHFLFPALHRFSKTERPRMFLETKQLAQRVPGFIQISKHESRNLLQLFPLPNARMFRPCPGADLVPTSSRGRLINGRS